MILMLANVVAQPMMPLVTQTVHRVADPAAAEAERDEARKRSRRLIERGFQLVISLILPAHAFLAFAAPFVMAIFGRTFAVNWGVFLVVLAWGAVTGITSLMGVALNALGRVWTVNALLAVYACCLVFFTSLFKESGATGLAWAHVGATTVSLTATAAVLLGLRLLSTQAVLMQLGAILWILLVTAVSFELPSEWRIAGIVLAVPGTVLALMAVLRAEMKEAAQLVLGKVKRKLRSRAG
jgi:hypothetical protein